MGTSSLAAAIGKALTLSPAGDDSAAILTGDLFFCFFFFDGDAVLFNALLDCTASDLSTAVSLSTTFDTGIEYSVPKGPTAVSAARGLHVDCAFSALSILGSLWSLWSLGSLGTSGLIRTCSRLPVFAGVSIEL